MLKPDSKEAFTQWSTESTCGTFSRDTQNWYQTGQNNLFNQLQTSRVFAQIERELGQYAQNFRETANTELFALGKTPKLEWSKKTYGSFLEKLYRLNCVENEAFPQPPSRGWTSLDGAFSSVDDIVRTTIVVAYADGPAFLASEIQKCAASHGVPVTIRDHAQEKGYYAQHLYIPLTVPIASRTEAGAFKDYQTPVEIQIVTQLQSSLREITHFLYEKERLGGGPSKNWKQDFRSGRFRAAYMAHSLRFIEAMIVELRDAVTEQTDGAKNESS